MRRRNADYGFGKTALQRLVTENNSYWYEGHNRVVTILREAGARE